MSMIAEPKGKELQAGERKEEPTVEKAWHRVSERRRRQRRAPHREHYAR